jgi:hypothetical protein
MHAGFLQPRMGLNGIADLTNTKYLIHKHTQSHIIIMAFSRFASLGFFAHCLRLQPAAPEQTRLCFLLLVLAAPKRVILMGGGHNKKPSAAARLGLFCALPSLATGCAGANSAVFFVTRSGCAETSDLDGGRPQQKAFSRCASGAFLRTAFACNRLRRCRLGCAQKSPGNRQGF